MMWIAEIHQIIETQRLKKEEEEEYEITKRGRYRELKRGWGE